jgi:hypothetical protein
LFWLLKLVVKDWLLQLQQNSLVLHAQPFKDIFMITSEVLMNGCSTAVSVQ